MATQITGFSGAGLSEVGYNAASGRTCVIGRDGADLKRVAAWYTTNPISGSWTKASNTAENTTNDIMHYHAIWDSAAGVMRVFTLKVDTTGMSPIVRIRHWTFTISTATWAYVGEVHTNEGNGGFTDLTVRGIVTGHSTQPYMVVYSHSYTTKGTDYRGSTFVRYDTSGTPQWIATRVDNGDQNQWNFARIASAANASNQATIVYGLGNQRKFWDGSTLNTAADYADVTAQYPSRPSNDPGYTSPQRSLFPQVASSQLNVLWTVNNASPSSEGSISNVLGAAPWNNVAGWHLFRDPTNNDNILIGAESSTVFKYRRLQGGASSFDSAVTMFTVDAQNSGLPGYATGLFARGAATIIGVVHNRQSDSTYWYSEFTLYAGANTATGAIADGGETLAGTAAPRVDAAGAIADGGETLAGIAAALVDAAGAITDGGEALAGTVSTHHATGALTDAGEVLAGTAAPQVDATGALTDAGEVLAGTAAPQVDATGTLTDAGEVLAGTVAPRADATGALTDAGEVLAGTAAPQVDATGALTDAGEVLAGTAAPQVDATGALTDAGEVLAGTGRATAVVNATGALTDAGEVLAGTAAAQVDATGALADAGEVLAGTVAPRVDATGALTDTGEVLAGTATLLWNATGALTDAGEVLAGTATLLWNATGALADAGEVLAGTAAPRVDAAGALADAGEVLAGTVAPRVDATGALTDAGEVLAGTGTITAAVNAAGALTDAGEVLAGTATLLWSATGTLTDAGEVLAGTASGPTSIVRPHIALSMRAAYNIGASISADQILTLSLDKAQMALVTLTLE